VKKPKKPIPSMRIANVKVIGYTISMRRKIMPKTETMQLHSEKKEIECIADARLPTARMDMTM
jgi:hypothetical protein